VGGWKMSGEGKISMGERPSATIGYIIEGSYSYEG